MRNFLREAFLLIFLVQFPSFNQAFNNFIGNQLKLVLEGWYKPPPPRPPVWTETPDQFPACPQVILPPRPRRCPDLENSLKQYLSKEVDEFVYGLFNSTPNFLDPFASDFQPEFSGTSTQIAAQAEVLAERTSQWQKQEPWIMGDNEWETCRKLAVFNMMGTHPRMNSRFWLKAFNHFILVNPELGDQLDFDPLTKLDPIQNFRRRKRMSAQFPGDGSPACPEPPPDNYPVPHFSSAVQIWEKCVGMEGNVSIPAENELWYFREDTGINSYHATWHNLHPIAGKVCRGGTTGCHSERRGELFYYFHRNLLARYDTERMTLGLPPVSPFQFKTGVDVNPGYNPGWNLRRKGYNSREAGLVLPNSLNTMKGQFSQFLHHISMIENLTDSFSQLRSRSGPTYAVDELMHAIEASTLTKYNNHGSIHNLGHVFLSDFGSSTTSPFNSVMAQIQLSLRDPLFYRWHKYVDNLLKRHKNKLQPYSINHGEFPLSWNSVSVSEVSASSLGGSSTTNVLNTFWRQRRYSPNEDCRKYLDHQDFQFVIKIKNYESIERKGTVRTFLAPKTDQNRVRLSLEEQRNFIFPLDIVNIDLKPGENVLRRNSSWLATASPRFNDKTLQENRRSGEVFCQCGHPHNLLLPKGSECGGVEYSLIVLVTDGTRYPFNFTEDRSAMCYRPPVTCGLHDGEAEVVLPFGYPFDRKIAGRYSYIEDLARDLENMKQADISIVHYNVLLDINEVWNPSAGIRWKSGSVNSMCIIDPPPSTVMPRTAMPSTTIPSYTMYTPLPADCWYDYSGNYYCWPLPPGYECAEHYGRKYCQPGRGTTITTPSTTTTPSVLIDCWYEYSGARNCLPIPPHYHCSQHYGQKYCQPGTMATTTTSTTPEPVTDCWYEYSGAQNCRPIPPEYQCAQHYGRKYCQPVTATTTTTTTAMSTTGCFYDQNNYRHCYTPPPDYNCYYTYGTKYCNRPDPTTTPAPTTSPCYYGYCGNTVRGYYTQVPTSYRNGGSHTHSYQTTPSPYTATGGYGYYGHNQGQGGYQQYGHTWQGYGRRK